MFVIALQPDLGTGIVYGVILAAVLFLAGAPWGHLAAGAALLVIAASMVLWVLPAAGVHVLEDYQRERLTAFVGSDRDTSDQGYQLDQSTTAIGSGGALGKGPDGATQTQNDFLPEHHTDFIFAVTAEMLGFVGGRGADPALCADHLARPARHGAGLDADRSGARGGDRRHARLPGVR